MSSRFTAAVADDDEDADARPADRLGSDTSKLSTCDRAAA